MDKKTGFGVADAAFRTDVSDVFMCKKVKVRLQG